MGVSLLEGLLCGGLLWASGLMASYPQVTHRRYATLEWPLPHRSFTCGWTTNSMVHPAPNLRLGGSRLGYVGMVPSSSKFLPMQVCYEYIGMAPGSQTVGCVGTAPASSRVHPRMSHKRYATLERPLPPLKFTLGPSDSSQKVCVFYIGRAPSLNWNGPGSFLLKV